MVLKMAGLKKFYYSEVQRAAVALFEYELKHMQNQHLLNHVHDHSHSRD